MPIQYSVVILLCFSMWNFLFVRCDILDTALDKNFRDENASSRTIFMTGKLPLTSENVEVSPETEKIVNTRIRRKRLKKKYQKYLLPLLLAYKLKFLALIPLLVGGLVLLVGSTGLAGFFFALFAAVLSLHPK